MKTPPELATSRLILNECVLADTQAVFSLFADDKVTQFYDLAAFETLEAARELIKQDAVKHQQQLMLRWAIRDKFTQQFLGGCGVNHFEPQRHVAVIGYELMPQAWGQGLATEALQAVIDYLFTKYRHPINRIEAFVMQGNIGSEKVLKKLGFKCEGVLRQHSYWKNQYHDLSLFSLLKHEYLQQE
ncbi:GNAT family N-acetyltransferase [Shewanella waksmanii]|uniref:GNAT family N-acetyltransferase n=1 Tax=Shewanella waksmanii TaxID=213783 RepID=UPI00048A9E45|nr:GNAT family protein [Shewanella waksmanii]